MHNLLLSNKTQALPPVVKMSASFAYPGGFGNRWTVHSALSASICELGDAARSLIDQFEDRQILIGTGLLRSSHTAVGKFEPKTVNVTIDWNLEQVWAGRDAEREIQEEEDKRLAEEGAAKKAKQKKKRLKKALQHALKRVRNQGSP